MYRGIGDKPEGIDGKLDGSRATVWMRDEPTFWCSDVVIVVGEEEMGRFWGKTTNSKRDPKTDEWILMYRRMCVLRQGLLCKRGLHKLKQVCRRVWIWN